MSKEDKLTVEKIINVGEWFDNLKKARDEEIGSVRHRINQSVSLAAIPLQLLKLPSLLKAKQAQDENFKKWIKNEDISAYIKEDADLDAEEIAEFCDDILDNLTAAVKEIKETAGQVVATKRVTSEEQDSLRFNFASAALAVRDAASVPGDFLKFLKKNIFIEERLIKKWREASKLPNRTAVQKMLDPNYQYDAVFEKSFDGLTDHRDKVATGEIVLIKPKAAVPETS